MSLNSNQNQNQDMDSLTGSMIPFIVKQFISEQTNSNFAKIAKRIGSEIVNYNNELSTSADLAKLQNARRLQSTVLHAQYAHHLGEDPRYINEVLTKYTTSHPGPKPKSTFRDAKGKLRPAPNYLVRLSEWKKLDKEFSERVRLENRINGLHTRFPHLKQLSNDLSSQIETAHQNIKLRSI